MSTEITDFVAELHQWVHERAASEEIMLRDAFVQVAGEALAEDGTLDNPESCFVRRQWKNRHLEVAGFDISTDGSVLRLLAAHYGEAIVKKGQIDQLVRYALNFAEACRGELPDQLEKSPQRDMAERIRNCWSEFEKVQVVALTDGTVSTSGTWADDLTAGSLPVAIQLWDLTRLHRLMTSGRRQEEIVIDLLEMGYEIPCLEAPKQPEEYECVLAVLPASLIAGLYDLHHSRLLQRNVRAFLQARTKVNKAIAETIKNNPGRFLAYNNGISATATSMEFGTAADGRRVIRTISDLQIVNGGQTTASLHVAFKAGVDGLSDVHVATKFTVVGDRLLDELVPKISMYANSQNAVTAADFEGNSPYHVEMEKHSRAIWAPVVSAGARQTHWYYERVRGQYDVDRARFSKRSEQKQFDLDNPKSQKITKTDAAKYELAYRRQPHIVSLGGQKCFQWWSMNGDPAVVETPTDADFRDLVAKTILYNRVRKLIQQQGYSGYLANITACTISLIVDRLGGALDLNRIWRAQAVPDSLERAVPDLATLVRAVITNAPGMGNVTEWAKKESSWFEVQRIGWTPPADLVADLAVPASNAA
ncbi:AIPR family protein [Pseudofrankia sp. BMG5.36]|uniref:AIPR family protein n=1 Tax=Pseudofrankia sp. BMG5.36 TaxID=1834512 RepID=UPI0008DA71A1|nr:AIPR family protein [Pseudofrankia sp. BMG5.36]OHV66828.1 abortive phage infection protein [Pseudofrankia sp. BMG5.36]